jgi:hypothetical protein
LNEFFTIHKKVFKQKAGESYIFHRLYYYIIIDYWVLLFPC